MTPLSPTQFGTGGKYGGWLYLYTLRTREPLTEEMARYDVDVSWRVTEDAYGKGDYEELWRGLRDWLKKELEAVSKP